MGRKKNEQARCDIFTLQLPDKSQKGKKMFANIEFLGTGKIKEVMEQIETVNDELLKLQHLLMDMQGLEIDPAPDKG